jgi:hypothetical protein
MLKKFTTIAHIRSLWRRATQELEVNIASVCDLADIVGCAPEWVLTFELAAELLVAIVRLLHIRNVDQRFASTTNTLVVQLLGPEVPEATRRHPVGAHAEFGLQFLLHVLDTCLRAVMLVVGTVVVEGVAAKLSSPG